MLNEKKNTYKKKRKFALKTLSAWSKFTKGYHDKDYVLIFIKRAKTF